MRRGSVTCLARLLLGTAPDCLAGSGVCAGASGLNACARDTSLLAVHATVKTARGSLSPHNSAGRDLERPERGEALVQSLLEAPMSANELPPTLLEGLLQMRMTPGIKETINQMLQDMVPMFSKIVDANENDTRWRDSFYVGFDNLNGQLNGKLNRTSGVKSDTVDAARETHVACRQNQESLHSNKSRIEQEVEDAKERRDDKLAIAEQKRSSLSSSHFRQDVTLGSLSVPAATEDVRRVKEYHDALEAYVKALQLHSNKTAELESSTAYNESNSICNANQAAFEGAVCELAESMQTSCQAYASAYDIRLRDYDDLTKNLAVRVMDRRQEWLHLKRIECIFRSLAGVQNDGDLATNRSASQPDITDCYEANITNDEFVILNISAPPARLPCPALPTLPCTPAFELEEYAELPVGAAAAECISACPPELMNPSTTPPESTNPATTPSPRVVSTFIVVASPRVIVCPFDGKADCAYPSNWNEDWKFSQIHDVALTSNGDYLVTDRFTNYVKRCPASGSGACSIVAGGEGQGQLNQPMGVAALPNGDYLVCDRENRRLQRCPASSAGDCITVGRGLNSPWNAVVAPNGDYIVAEQAGHRIRRCPANDSAECITVAGGTAGKGPQQNGGPTDVALAPNGDYVFVDHNNQRVQRCPASGSGDCVIVAGVDGDGASSRQLSAPLGVIVAPNGDYLVSDTGNGRVQRCPASGSGDCVTVPGSRGKGYLTGLHFGLE